MDGQDRNKRIAERRERIQQRLNANKKADQDLNNVVEEKQITQSLPEQKISEQLTALRAASQAFSSQIEQLQKRADQESTQIFSNDAQSQVKRRNVLEQLREQNQQQSAAFEMRWSGLIQRKQPEDLLAGLIELRQLMLTTLSAKDDIAKAFEDYLNQVDDDYLRLNNEQASEIDEIISFARKSIKELQENCRKAVTQCENAFDAERQRFIDDGERFYCFWPSRQLTSLFCVVLRNLKLTRILQ
ncbi:Conserved_hypothetical protein [Hexamita inflata]|uniref:Dynein regulatory complex protein 1/2 N-terminal domain-containing protein n=1 Tax=Hexamita inflata TaxID=28002 RepID=A0AA86NZL8_9EUKA|nr:Conserved hypothetical protein [Hexamita inflata]